jgi:hypothetical protein
MITNPIVSAHEGQRLLQHMRVRLTLHPYQNGAKQRHAHYGDRLICVRYRYDGQRQKRLKPVELIVEERDWHPHTPQRAADRVVQLRVALPKVSVRQQIKRAGGRWNPQRGVWELRYERVVALGLVERIVDSEGGAEPHL